MANSSLIEELPLRYYTGVVAKPIEIPSIQTRQIRFYREVL